MALPRTRHHYHVLFCWGAAQSPGLVFIFFISPRLMNDKGDACEAWCVRRVMTMMKMMTMMNEMDETYETYERYERSNVYDMSK